MGDAEAVLRWLLVLTVAGLAGLPVAARLLGDSGRRAIWFARPIGMLSFFFPVWFLSSVVNLPFTRIVLAASLLIIVLTGWHWFYHSGTYRQLHIREVLTAEIVTLAALLGAIWLRGVTPDIKGTEKTMDSAFLSSVILTDRMPPPDPWMAGESINYYYLGYGIHGALAKIAGVASPLAFNLALATTTALALVAAIGCALVIAPRYARIVAPLAAFFAVIAGNMDGPYRVLTQGRDAWEARWWGGMGWESSRVVYDGTIQTINEFPAFSIILGDLHPHLMALPFTIVALAITAGFARSAEPIGWVRIGLAGMFGGSLYALNSWDFPTYFGLMVLALIWNHRASGPRAIALRVGAMAGAAFVAWAPFILTFSPFVAGDPESLPTWLQGIPIVESALTTVAFNTFQFTSAGEFLRIFGLFYVLILATLIVAARGVNLERKNFPLFVGVPFTFLILVALLGNAPVFIFVAVPTLLAVALLRRMGPATVEGAIASLFLAGALIISLTELFFIQDQFHNRMNTLFKAYYQVWTLWGIAAAVGLGWMLSRAPKFEFRVAASVAVVASLVLGLIYPVVSTVRWMDEFDASGGLDGSAFIAELSEDELAGIEFIRANATAESVLLEAPGCSYQVNFQIPYGRVSAFTGVPTVMGWVGHEGQWRSGDDALRAEIIPRRDAVQEFYRTPSADLIDRYNIEFVYYGIYEQGDGQRACEWAVPLPMPDAAVMTVLGFQIAFQQGDVTIWQRSD